MNDPRDRPIGAFDSGVGGLTVVQAMRQLLPAEDILYLGDTARVPYGNKSPETIVRYSRENLAFLSRHGVKAVVVACNTASAHALAVLQKESDVPVIGVIAPGVEAALAATRNGRIGIVGTQGTIHSAAYQDLLRQLRPGRRHHRRGRAAARLAGGGGLASARRHAADPGGISRADARGARSTPSCWPAPIIRC